MGSKPSSNRYLCFIYVSLYTLLVRHPYPCTLTLLVNNVSMYKCACTNVSTNSMHVYGACIHVIHFAHLPPCYTYIGSFVVKQVVMICNKPSLLPMWTDPTTTMFIEPASFSGVDKCGGCRTIWNLRLIIVLSITLQWNPLLVYTQRSSIVPQPQQTKDINHESQSNPILIVVYRYELTLLYMYKYMQSYQHAGNRSQVIFCTWKLNMYMYM